MKSPVHARAALTTDAAAPPNLKKTRQGFRFEISNLAGGSAFANPPRLSLQVLIVFSFIYLFTWAGHYTSGDASYKIAWAKQILGYNPGRAPDANGVYSKYGIGHTLLDIPPVALSHWIEKRTGVRTEAALCTLMFVVNGAFFLALIAYYLAHFYPRRDVWPTVLILGLATIWWPYTKIDYSEPLVLTIAFLGFLVMRFGSPMLGMLIAGFILTIRADAVVIIASLAVWYLLAHRSLRAAAKIALAMAPSIALVLFANFIRYHSLLDQGYSGEHFSNPFLVGLYGILLSSGKSIFLFSPPLILGILGWKRFARQKETASDAWLFLSICVLEILLFAKWWDWSSDDAWGIRFLIPGVLLLCIPLVTVVHRKVWVAPLVAAGVAVQLLAVSVGGLTFVLLLHNTQAQRQALYVPGTNRLDFEDIRYDPNYSQIEGNWILVRYLLHFPPASGEGDDVSHVGTPLSEAIPARDWAAAAHWDSIWHLHRAGSKPLAPSVALK